jgi:Fe-S-cluster containining protein
MRDLGTRYAGAEVWRLHDVLQGVRCAGNRKPVGKWCQNCAIGQSCRIYEQRPKPCRDFYCLWKVMPDFPEALRPDRCKVIWTMTEDGSTAVATTEYPKALHAKAQEELFRQFSRAGISVVVRERPNQSC